MIDSIKNIKARYWHDREVHEDQVDSASESGILVSWDSWTSGSRLIAWSDVIEFKGDKRALQAFLARMDRESPGALGRLGGQGSQVQTPPERSDVRAQVVYVERTGCEECGKRWRLQFWSCGCVTRVSLQDALPCLSCPGGMYPHPDHVKVCPDHVR